jgi:hypothetical protein
MSEMNSIHQTWPPRSRVGIVGVVPAVLTLIAGLCLAIGFSANDWDGLLWAIWGIVIGLFALCWAAVATLVALIALAWPNHQPFPRLRTRRDASAVLAANGTVVLIWMLCILAVMVASGAVGVGLILILASWLASLSGIVISIYATRQWLAIRRPQRVAIALALFADTAVLILTGLWLTGLL